MSHLIKIDPKQHVMLQYSVIHQRESPSSAMVIPQQLNTNLISIGITIPKMKLPFCCSVTRLHHYLNIDKQVHVDLILAVAVHYSVIHQGQSPQLCEGINSIIQCYAPQQDMDPTSEPLPLTV